MAEPTTVLEAAFGLDQFTDPSEPDGSPFVLARDSFTRANSATTLGNEEEHGLAWQVSAGSTWGISSNRAYRVGPASASWQSAWVDCGTPDQVVSAELPVMAATIVGLALRGRVTDANDGYLLQVSPVAGALILYREVAGVFTDLGTHYLTPPVAGDKVTLAVVGSRLYAAINDVVVIRATDTGITTGDGAGIGQYDLSTAPRFGHFEVTSPAWQRLDNTGSPTNAVRGLNTRRGRPADRTLPAEPGEGVFVVDNRNRRLDPANTDSEFSPYVTAGVQLRARLIPPDTYPNALSDDDSGAERTVGTWTGHTNASVTRDTNNSRHGRACHRIAATAAGDATAGTALGAYLVTPGDVLTGAMALAPATTARSVKAQLKFYNAGGGVISTHTGTPVAEVAGRYTEVPYISATAPALSNRVVLEVVVVAAGAGEVHYADESWLVVGPDLAGARHSRPGGYPLGRYYVDHDGWICDWELGDAWVTITGVDAHGPLAGRVLPDSVADIVRYNPTGGRPPIHAYPMGEDRPEGGAFSIADLRQPTSLASHGIPSFEPQKAEPLMPYQDRRPFAPRATGNSYLSWFAAAVMPVAPWTIEVGMRPVDKEVCDPVKLTTTNRSVDISILPGMGAAYGRTAANAIFGTLLKTGYMRPHYVVVGYDGSNLFGWVDSTYCGGGTGVMKSHGTYLLVGMKPALGADPLAFTDVDVGDLYIYDYLRTAPQIVEQWNALIAPWGTDATVGARVATVLGAMGWDPALLSAPATDDAVAPARLRSDTLLDYLRRLEATEDGSRLWVAPEGYVAFRARSMAPPASEVLDGSGAAGRPYHAVSTALGGEGVYTVAQITPASPIGSEPVIARGASTPSAGETTLTLEGTEHPSAVAAYESGVRRVASTGQPTTVLRSVVLTPQRADVGWAAALGRDMGRRLIVQAAPPGGGPAFSQLAEVIAVNHDWGQGDSRFTTTFELAYISEAA